MKAKKLFLNLYCFIEAKRIDRELKNVNWESEYGLTHDKMEEIKKVIYKRLMEQIRIYEEVKGNG